MRVVKALTLAILAALFIAARSVEPATVGAVPPASHGPGIFSSFEDSQNAFRPSRQPAEASSEIAPYSKRLPRTRPSAACPPASGRQATCFAALVPAEDGRALVPSPTEGGGEIEATELEGSGVEGGLSPADLRSAYAVTGEGGKGNTIAIVDAFDDPNAEKDLAVYRKEYGLSPCTTENGCFKKVNQYGEAGKYPEPNIGWSVEISLDLDMASAICPECNILLVEANSNSFADLDSANKEAAALGATVISDSWGTEEFSEETSEDPSYKLSAPIFVSSGDSGYGVSYPAASPNVIAVGGTSLHKDPESARGWSETAWSGAGSGCSLYELKPAWQTDTGCPSWRSVTDVSAVADVKTPLSIYDTYNWYEPTEWLLVGGTSASAPIVAATTARASASDREKRAELFWQEGPEGKLFDVADGRNGRCFSPKDYFCDARVGYDGPTGWGTPGAHRPAAPTVGTYGPSGEKGEEAMVNGALNPNGKATKYHFEYGTTTEYGSSSPATEAEAGSGITPQGVSKTVAGLSRNTVYHYRLAASNEIGTSYGADETFAVTPWGVQETFETEEFYNYNTQLLSTSCNSSENCMAVGYKGYQPFATHWNGSIWEPETVAKAFGEGFFDVSCPSATFCMAVGERLESGRRVPFSEIWHESTWTLQSVPLPSGGSEPEQISSGFQGVSCLSESFCVAVGHYYEKFRKRTLAEVWNGGKWLVQPSADVEGNEGDALVDVSCTSQSACIAVGSNREKGPVEVKTLAEIWNGSTWSIQPTPDLPGKVADELASISCGSANACMAVGWTRSSTEGVETAHGEPLGMRWNGTEWLEAIPHDALSSVSCESPTSCVAVGRGFDFQSYGIPYFENQGIYTYHAVTERWTGSEWRSEVAMTPEGVSAEAGLNGVSCYAVNSCMGVGWFAWPRHSGDYVISRSSALPEVKATGAANLGAHGATLRGLVNPNGIATKFHIEFDTKPYENGEAPHGSNLPTTDEGIGSGEEDVAVSEPVEGLKAGTTYHYRIVATNEEGTTYGEDGAFTTWGAWSTQTTPNPPAPPAPLAKAKLSGVSCAASTMCLAVGEDAANAKALGELWDGSEWTMPLSKEELKGTRNGVACTSTSSCILVGSSAGAPVAERWIKISGVWLREGSGAQTPSGGSEVKLTDIACTSSSACTAVGSYLKEGVTKTLAERWNGTSWSIQTTPNPESGSAELLGVSCDSSTSCTAVGKQGSSPYAMRWNGTSWSTSTMPTPSGAVETSPQKVSCPNSSFCFAVGSYREKTGPNKTLTEKWNGSSWSVTASPNPAESKGSTLAGISCTSSTACTAVGRYNTAVEFEIFPTESKTLVESWGGSEWQVQSSPNPGGKKLPQFAGVSCSAANACTAVGWAQKGAGTGEGEMTTLGERYE
jgi:hypothetical protein